MKYAKLIDGRLNYAPSVLRVDGRTIINPNGKTLWKYGYLPLGESIMPMAMEGHEVHAVGYEVKDGQIVRTWEQVPIPPKTEEEFAEERKRAYEAECDQYLIAYQGYLLEGNLEAAEICKQAYLAKKREIRARIS